MTGSETVEAPAPERSGPAITDCNVYILVALGGLPALKPPPLPTRTEDLNV